MVSVCRRFNEPSTTCLMWSARLLVAVHLPWLPGSGSNPNLVAITTSFAEGSESFAHDLFIDERAIHFGSVEGGDTALDSGANELDRFALLRGGAKTEAQAHASEAEC